jgi:hypothetical protein
MKDNLILLLPASAFALVAWAFWHFFGENGFSVISTLALIVLFIDNLRLRRKLRSER